MKGGDMITTERLLALQEETAGLLYKAHLLLDKPPSATVRRAYEAYLNASAVSQRARARMFEALRRIHAEMTAELFDCENDGGDSTWH